MRRRSRLPAHRDLFRSIPLIIPLILFFNLFPIVGFPLDPFAAGTFVLSIYMTSLVANVARGGIESVDLPVRRAARSLGMSYWQDMRYVVWPIGLRAVFPAWIGVALGVLKDSALVSVLGYVELLRASQILITRTQEPLLILAVSGAFYFSSVFSNLAIQRGYREKIARALAMEPSCMLFDEATSALDPKLVGEVLDTMRVLAEEGMTMICVTHEMGFARDVSDRVAYFHEGVMEEIGPPGQIFGEAQSEHTRRFLANVR